MSIKIEKWGVFETRLVGPKSGNPFKDVVFSAVFTMGNRTVPVAGFYDGGGEYVVRFMPDTEGAWTYRTVSSAKQLDGQTGSFECVAPSKGNHGPVGVDKDHHFRYADRSFYSCIGTTSYAWIHQGDTLARQTLASLKNSPFNKLRMTVFPKSYIYNEHDDPQLFPFPLLKKGGTTRDGHLKSKGGTLEWRFDLDRFDTTFFAMLDTRIRQLMEMNVEADVILFHPYDRWGFAQMSRETDLFYLRYVIARIGAFRNVWWSLANEYDYMEHKIGEDWETIGRTIAECDPYHRLTGIHNGSKWFDHRRSWITHCSIQTSEFQIRKWREEYRKPIVIEEMSYEGMVPFGWGNISGLEMMRRFWDVALNGGYPGHSECFLRPNHVMWWNKGGVLRGESPARIAFLRKLMESGPDMGMEPHPERMRGLSCGCKGDDWILCYTGMRQPNETLAKLPAGKRYRLTHIDPWNMTVKKTKTIITGAGNSEVSVPLSGKTHRAFLLESVD
ncbi:MAG: DUF5060 domain-containing protein [Kiritimatiellia bacterium]